MNRFIASLTVTVLCSACTLHADFGIENRGSWPSDWPKELEPLRATSRTLDGPLIPTLHYAIPFTQRDQFEATWPHFLKVKTKGTPILLRSGPSTWLGENGNAGVCVHAPPAGQVPIADGKNATLSRQNAIYIELIVDGDIVDLNRIPLPPDTTIIDERFKQGMPKR